MVIEAMNSCENSNGDLALNARSGNGCRSSTERASTDEAQNQKRNLVNWYRLMMIWYLCSTISSLTGLEKPHVAAGRVALSSCIHLVLNCSALQAYRQDEK